MWNSDTISLQQTNTSLSTFNSLTSDIQKPAEPQAAAQDGEAGSNTAKSSNNARVAATSRSDLNVGTGAAAERRKKRVSQSLSNKSYALKEDAETAAAEEADDNLLNAVCKNSLTTAPSFLLPQLFLSLTSVLCITTVEFAPFYRTAQHHVSHSLSSLYRPLLSHSLVCSHSGVSGHLGGACSSRPQRE